MRTILISSFHQLIPRNILFTAIPDLLVDDPQIRLILLVPENKKQFFVERISHERIVIEGVKLGGSTRTLRDRIMGFLAIPLTDTQSLRVLFRGRLVNHKRRFHYFFYYIPLRTLGRIRLIRACFRRIDAFLASKKRFEQILNTYNPNLIFSTDVMDKYDAELIFAGRRKNIRVVSMVRSWDNLTKFGLLRAIPDRLLVWNDLIQKEAIEYQDVAPEKIRVVGIPHYDRYTHGTRMTREEFFRSLGIDPAKKLIFFAPTGVPRLFDNNADRVHLGLLKTFNTSIFVRFPPTNPVHLDSHSDSPHVFFDRPGVVFGQSPKMIDALMDRKDDMLLCNAVYWSDVVVSGPSTIALDAAVFAKPLVLVDFSGSSTPYLDDAGESYKSIHMQYVVESGGVRMATSPDELLNSVREYLSSPLKDAGARAQLQHSLFGVLDGKACSRMVQALLEKLMMSK
ncbi:MAG: hypothetical protein G01um101466_196 [Parcubacteria group bacterium Gr01-1014_66]|nr:MAG: hypothetical protein G01um101466_196 [Parcubacteria group bacterium Gr01-1014_66]